MYLFLHSLSFVYLERREALFYCSSVKKENAHLLRSKKSTALSTRIRSTTSMQTG